MYFGVDYYPEHWPIEIMDEDINRIKEMGANVVRIGEFAWHIIEKEEGKYDFAFFDKVIKKLKDKNIKVVFGTPTATPPAWLVKKHPSVLSKDENLMERSFGGRRQYCYNSDVYYEYTKKIVKELVEHYKDEENVIVWQIDNEFGHEGSDECYCEQCHDKFQRFLKDKYRNIEDLNKAWGTVFWSQTYNDFSEIPLPLKTITHHNPAMQLDHARFRDTSIARYSDFQVEIVKNIVKDKQKVTTNLPGGSFDKYYDPEKIMNNMDFASYDNYPVWGGLVEPIPPSAIAAALDYIRGLRKKNFWVLEQLMGAQGHTVIGYLPRPNQAKMWSYQAVAHGAESLLYFRWRGATFGTEEFCFGIIDQDNKSKRKYNEVQSTIKDLNNYKKVIESPIKSDIAVIYDYDNAWSWKIQPQSAAFNFNNELLRLYTPFYMLNTHMDIISKENDFSAYKVLIIPVMMITDDKFEKAIKDFVSNGGTVIFSFRLGIKDRNNNLNFGETIPGAYKELTGIEINEIESLGTNQSVEIVGEGEYKGVASKCTVWRDIIDCTQAKPLYTYSDYFYKGKACITVNSYGKGKVYYVGAGVETSILLPIAKQIVTDNEIENIETPDGLEVYIREVDGEKHLFLMNHTEFVKEFNGNKLEPFESKIIRLEE